MDIEQARVFLREQMVAAAAATIPDGTGPFVEDDDGPSAPGAIFDGRSRDYTCYIVVTAGDPHDTRTAGGHVTEAARVMAEMGWQVDTVDDEGDHYHCGAHRDGFDVAIKMWKDERALQLTGETPAFRLKKDPTGR